MGFWNKNPHQATAKPGEDCKEVKIGGNYLRVSLYWINIKRRLRKNC